MNTTPQFPPHKSMVLLSRLLLAPQTRELSAPQMPEDLRRDITSISREQFSDLLTLANLNHVVVRGMNTFLAIVREAGDDLRAQWALDALAEEEGRINTAVPF